ncbi:MAG: hypothetical protein FWE23_08885 [Chitinivibrionia bacterium]|nr:hypothetical protein [Chitinivibrionia bacterium]
MAEQITPPPPQQTNTPPPITTPQNIHRQQLEQQKQQQQQQQQLQKQLQQQAHAQQQAASKTQQNVDIASLQRNMQNFSAAQQAGARDQNAAAIQAQREVQENKGRQRDEQLAQYQQMLGLQGQQKVDLTGRLQSEQAAFDRWAHGENVRIDNEEIEHFNRLFDEALYHLDWNKVQQLIDLRPDLFNQGTLNLAYFENLEAELSARIQAANDSGDFLEARRLDSELKQITDILDKISRGEQQDWRQNIETEIQTWSKMPPEDFIRQHGAEVNIMINTIDRAFSAPTPQVQAIKQAILKETGLHAIDTQSLITAFLNGDISMEQLQEISYMTTVLANMPEDPQERAAYFANSNLENVAQRWIIEDGVEHIMEDLEAGIAGVDGISAISVWDRIMENERVITPGRDPKNDIDTSVRIAPEGFKFNYWGNDMNAVSNRQFEKQPYINLMDSFVSSGVINQESADILRATFEIPLGEWRNIGLGMMDFFNSIPPELTDEIFKIALNPSNSQWGHLQWNNIFGDNPRHIRHTDNINNWKSTRAEDMDSVLQILGDILNAMSHNFWQ